jgi:hypothetical protein
MMDHGNIKVFLNHYLDRRVSADTAAIVRGINPQEAIMRSACTMSRWIDPDRPWGLTAEQASSVNNDPLIKSLIEHRSRIKQRLGTKFAGYPLYKELEKRIQSERKRLRNELLVTIQKNYERDAPVRAIERQLAGVKISKEPKVMSYFSKDTLPEQRRLIETIILAPPGATLDEEVRRRNDAINAVTAYCKIEEGETPKRGKATSQLKSTFIKKEEDMKSSQELALEAAMLSVLKDKRPTICFLCLGNEIAPLAKRMYSFSTSGDLSKHFKRKHLSNIKDHLECKVCKLDLEHETHLRNHALAVHGTVS